MKIDDLKIDKVLDNEASVEDAKVVVGWFATPEGNEYLSQRLDKEMQAMSEDDIRGWKPNSVPEERMRQRFMEQIKPKHRTIRPWWWAAVLLPFLLLSGSVLFLADRVGLFSRTEYAELAVPTGEQMRVVLQDGTIVHLNSASRLKYPKQFGLFNRSIELWGEGYFEVTKDKRRPFLIDLQGLDVRVTGTKFNVKSYASDANVRVSLDEGGVTLKGIDGLEYALKPGESAEYDRQSGTCRISRPEKMEEHSAWRSNSLNFYMVPLKEIVNVLERQYSVHFVVVDSTLMESRFTFSTTKVDVSDILNDLQTVSFISFKETKEGVFEICKRQ